MTPNDMGKAAQVPHSSWVYLLPPGPWGSPGAKEDSGPGPGPATGNVSLPGPAPSETGLSDITCVLGTTRCLESSVLVSMRLFQSSRSRELREEGGQRSGGSSFSI